MNYRQYRKKEQSHSIARIMLPSCDEKKVMLLMSRLQVVNVKKLSYKMIVLRYFFKNCTPNFTKIKSHTFESQNTPNYRIENVILQE